MKTSHGAGHFFDRAAHGGVAPRILSAFSVSRRGPAPCSEFKHPFWVIDYAVSDCGRFKVGGGGWRPRLAGTAHLYMPGVAYREDCRDVSGPMESRYVTFLGGELAGLDKLVQNGGGFAEMADPGGELGEMLLGMARAASGGDKNFWLAQGLLSNVLDLLLKNMPKAGAGDSPLVLSASEPRTEGELFVARVRSLLGKNLSGSVELSDLARRLHVSVSTLSHKYASFAGESPLQTLARMRIELARSLLLRGEPLKNVASQTGFYDEFHLSKAFKRLMGCPPKRYVKSMLQKSIPTN